MNKTISVPSAQKAYLIFKKYLSEKGCKIYNSKEYNNSRHELILTDKYYFYCLYRKHSPDLGTFCKFNNYFSDFIKEYPEFCGHAETINKEIINNIINIIGQFPEKEFLLIFIYYNEEKEKFTRYACNPYLFKKFAEKHNLIRKHIATDHKISNTKIQEIHETTYHLPFKEMFFKNFDKFI